jgi:hypothetical protein
VCTPQAFICVLHYSKCTPNRPIRGPPTCVPPSLIHEHHSRSRGLPPSFYLYPSKNVSASFDPCASLFLLCDRCLHPAIQCSSHVASTRDKVTPVLSCQRSTWYWFILDRHHLYQINIWAWQTCQMDGCTRNPGILIRFYLDSKSKFHCLNAKSILFFYFFNKYSTEAYIFKLGSKWTTIVFCIFYIEMIAILFLHWKHIEIV